MSSSDGASQGSRDASNVEHHDYDVSFMDTEQLDLSVLNTEPLDTSVQDTEPMIFDVGSSDETEASKDESEEDAKSQSNYDIDESILGTSGSDSDESLNGSENREAVPPPIDITTVPSHEIKRIYSDLIDSCRGFEDTTSNSSHILESNITTGEALFRQMEVSLCQSLDESADTDQNTTSRNMLGSFASELYLACQHTKVCSTMLKQAVKNVGVSACAFKFDEFLDLLRSKAVDQAGGYSPLAAVRKLACTYSSASHSVQNFQTMFGCLEKDDFVRTIQPPPPKESKRLPRKKDENKEEDATQSEVMNETSQSKNDADKNGTPEGVAKQILKTVKTKCKQQDAPQNLLEIAHADNVPDLLSRLFGVAFVVQNVKGLAPTTAITLKPERPPDKTGAGKDDKRRNQYIASFPASLLKALAKTRENISE